MSGRTGTLVTGHCVINAATGQLAAAVAATSVRFGTPSERENRPPTWPPASRSRWPGRSPWTDGAAGSWTGSTAITCNVLGISLPLLRRLLAELGFGVTELWA